jgi:hypothetical protein
MLEHGVRAFRFVRSDKRGRDDKVFVKGGSWTNHSGGKRRLAAQDGMLHFQFKSRIPLCQKLLLRISQEEPGEAEDFWQHASVHLLWLAYHSLANDGSFNLGHLRIVESHPSFSASEKGT